MLDILNTQLSWVKTVVWL